MLKELNSPLTPSSFRIPGLLYEGVSRSIECRQMAFMVTLTGLLLLASPLSWGQQTVVTAVSFTMGSVSSRSPGIVMRGILGEAINGGASRDGAVEIRNGSFSFVALGGYVTGAGAELPLIPLTFEVAQNFPNPFNPSTTIRYAIPRRSFVTLTVYNALGQELEVLQNGEQEAGVHDVRFDATGFSSGVYFYRVQAGSDIHTKRLVLLR
jgi:hypothetical protein